MRKKLLSTMDVGEWAEFYAALPYGHYKRETYALFTDVLACLRRPLRVLDLGAGPGHLAAEFARSHPKARARFVLLDSSERMLEIAERRLSACGVSFRTVHRSFNMAGWDGGLGAFDAIVSNNALFHVRPRRLAGFYRDSYALLRADGVLLNQQSFAYEGRVSPYGADPFAEFVRELPEHILPGAPVLSDSERARAEREKRDAKAAHEEAINRAQAAGTEFVSGQTSYQFLTAEKHLDLMRRAGFQAGSIWRKRDFAVLLGTRGRPRLRRASRPETP
jgi:SAM-dependent methyltransferase